MCVRDRESVRETRKVREREREEGGGERKRGRKREIKKGEQEGDSLRKGLDRDPIRDSRDPSLGSSHAYAAMHCRRQRCQRVQAGGGTRRDAVRDAPEERSPQRGYNPANVSKYATACVRVCGASACRMLCSGATPTQCRMRAKLGLQHTVQTCKVQLLTRSRKTINIIKPCF